MERDSDAHILRIRPVGRLMRFVVPRVTLSSPWTHHVTTAVEKHGVDALTGAPGTAWNQYLDAHFEYSDAVVVERWTGELR